MTTATIEALLTARQLLVVAIRGGVVPSYFLQTYIRSVVMMLARGTVPEDAVVDAACQRAVAAIPGCGPRRRKPRKQRASGPLPRRNCDPKFAPGSR
jgi:hypothetical protein